MCVQIWQIFFSRIGMTYRKCLLLYKNIYLPCDKEIHNTLRHIFERNFDFYLMLMLFFLLWLRKIKKTPTSYCITSNIQCDSFVWARLTKLRRCRILTQFCEPGLENCHLPLACLQAFIFRALALIILLFVATVIMF